MAENDLMRELTDVGSDTPSSSFSFTANDDPEKQELATKVMRNIAGAMGGVNKWRQGAKEDYRYYYGHQWPDLDRMRMEQLRRPALVFNEIGDKVDAISGIERLNRSEVRFVTRAIDSDVMHDAAGDLATAGVSEVEDGCNGEIEDSRCIKDVIVSGMGWVEVRTDYQTDLDGVIVKERQDNMEYVWDQKAHVENLQDRQWCARIRNYSRKDFEKRWPGAAEKVDNAAVYYQEDGTTKYELVTPYYSVANEKANPSIDAQATASVSNIPVIQYQWIDMVPVYRIADPQNPDQLKTLSMEQWSALQTKMALAGTPMPKGVRQLQGIHKQVYVALGVVLEDAVVLPSGYSLICITGQWDSDKKVWYGVVRGLKDPQNTINKSVSALVTEYITNSKGGFFYKTGFFVDLSMAKAQIAQPDSLIEVNQQFDIQKDIQQREPKQISQTPSLLYQESKSAMTRISGVSDEMVGTATGEATGPTIDRRVQGGLAILGWLWDNVTRFKKETAQVELEFIREYWSHGQLVQVGGDFNAQSIPLLKSDLPLKYGMVLDQGVRYNPNLKAQIWEDLLKIAGPLMKNPAGQIILSKALKFSPWPSQLVQEIQQAIQNAPPQPPKGAGRKEENPDLTQAKIKKMDAETQRTIAEAAKLDKESHLHLAELTIGAIHKGQELRDKSEQRQHQQLQRRIQMARQQQQPDLSAPAPSVNG